jgi:hypothetical protein
MPPFHELVKDSLPRLTATNYRITSSASWQYNCIAWAADITDAWWWPAPGRYWPSEAPREETIAAFLAAFASLGYQPIADSALEPAVEKLVLYAQNETPTHAARQLADGWWTSKLGPNIDIEHETPDAVTGGLYGEVVAVLGRATIVPATNPPAP